MKKHFLIILALVGLIVSCKLDDAGFTQNSIQKNALLGKWLSKKAISYTPHETFVDTDFTAKDYYIFNANNTLTLSSSNPDTIITSPYTYDANSKIISGGPDIEDKLHIVKLTADSLIWTGVVSASTGDNNTTYTNIAMVLSRK